MLLPRNSQFLETRSQPPVDGAHYMRKHLAVSRACGRNRLARSACCLPFVIARNAWSGAVLSVGRWRGKMAAPVASTSKTRCSRLARGGRANSIRHARTGDYSHISASNNAPRFIFRWKTMVMAF